MRNQCQIARVEHVLGFIDLENASAGSNHVQHEAVLHRGNGKCPRQCEFRATVKGAAHAEKMQSLTDRIRQCRKLDLHISIMPECWAIFHKSWMNEHEIATHRHCCAR